MLDSLRIDSLHLSISALASTAAVFATSYYVLYGLLEIHKSRGYHQIPKLPVLQILRSFFRRMSYRERYERIIRAIQEKDGISRINYFGRAIIHISSTEYARQLLTNTEDFPKRQFPSNAFGHLLGTNIVFSNGEVWKRHRRICNPAFHKSWTTDIFGERTEAMIRVIQANIGKDANKDGIHAFEFFQRFLLSIN